MKISVYSSVCQAIKINASLTIQLQCEGSTVPLPKRMMQGHNGKLTRISMLQNFPKYFACVKEKLPKSMLNELKEREVYHPAPEIYVTLSVQTFT